MNERIERALRLKEALDSLAASRGPFVSLVFPTPDGRSAQIFLPWSQGKRLRDYVRDPKLRGKLGLQLVIDSRVLDQSGTRRRLTHVPQPDDEYRIIRVKL